MILTSHDYNPFPAILQMLSDDLTVLTIPLANDIRRELFKGGVVPESDKDFDTLLDSLADEGLIVLESADNGRTLIKRGI